MPTYGKAKINISIECYSFLYQNIICCNSYSTQIYMYILVYQYYSVLMLSSLID